MNAVIAQKIEAIQEYITDAQETLSDLGSPCCVQCKMFYSDIEEGIREAKRQIKVLKEQA